MPSISPANGTPALDGSAADRTAMDRAALDRKGGPAAGSAASVPAMTRTRPFGWLLVITGVVGWFASGVLVLEKLEVLKDPGHTTVCDVNPWISCGQVMQTWQSSVFGFPNMFIGIVAFAVVITIGMALLAGATFARWYWIGLQVGVTLGFAFVVWLWSQALYVINILCPFCMVVWAAMIPLFVWVTIRNITAGVIPVPARAARVLGDSGWVVTALLYVAVIATIFFAFIQVFAGTSGY
ncbi:vitamin K epoxide reductase family protein [Pseudarthrobacter sp. NPDC092424]|uniref:vitamin K epoxide reductase family protein n=1 Tax=Pseudarthrobacter sp. NPDC092424 TaxID=3364415 RepID=UPI0037F7F39F